MTRSSRKKPFPFFVWHRRLGLLSLLLMIILAITGIMLNHTEALNMDEITIESDSLLDWYELNPKGMAVGYQTEENTIAQWDGQLFFNSKALLNSKQSLLGAVITNEIIVLALSKSILLLDITGEIIEHMDMPIKFESINKLGLRNNSVIIQTKDLKVFSADKDIIDWQLDNDENISWSTTIDLDPSQLQALKKSFRGNGLSLERIILDLHSGRLFSANWGIYIMDASAIIIIMLSLSGFWVWWTRKQKIKSKRHYRKHH
jgi:hypothetical protein